MKEIKAVKLTLKIWQKIAVHPQLGYDRRWDIKEECAAEVGNFRYNCPCCEYATTPLWDLNCKICPMKSFWGEGQAETLCLHSKTSPYREFAHGDPKIGAWRMVELCELALEDWKDYNSLIKRVKKINPDAARYMRREAREIHGFAFSKSLACAFAWSCTPQGHNFWEEINNVL